MPLTLTILDETTAGERRSAGDFQFHGASMTVRELILSRVRQEVERFNSTETKVFRGLVEPEESERILNGVRARPVLDWEKQYGKAVAAFQGNGFLVMVDGRQILDLDETFSVTAQTEISFLRLIPLIGG